jgi:translation initiation factor 3 subunit C
MFELPEKRVYSIVSKMMFTEELHGSWDQPTKTIVMHNLEASKVRRGQLLGLGLAAVSMLLSAWG